MHSEMGIAIWGDIGRVWALASALESWAQILPHYRYVRVVEALHEPERAILDMSAWRGRIPLRWRSLVELLPDEHRILFQHIGGAARGMIVEWRIVADGGLVRATIRHDLDSRYPILRSRLGEYILGHQVIDYVAGRTLRRIKELVEAEK